MRIVLDESSRALALTLGGRWKKAPAEVHVLEDGIDGLIRLLEEDPADVVAMCSLSSVSVFDARALLDLGARRGGELVKASIQKTPVEMYLTRRSLLLRLLTEHAPRVRKHSRSREYLFEGILFSSIDLLEELPGELLFQNDLMEFYRRNLWLANNCTGEEFNRVVSRVPPLAEKLGESRISERGHLKDSYIAAGAEVEGYVEGSVIFPNVTVRANARVLNSIVTNNNRIGAGSTVQNAVILPFTNEGARNSPNIGENCDIGGRSPTAANEDFPEQIREGLTLIGMNVAMPGGFRAEPGSFIGPGATASQLRRQKIVKKGTSFFEGGTKWSSKQ